VASGMGESLCVWDGEPQRGLDLLSGSRWSHLLLLYCHWETGEDAECKEETFKYLYAFNNAFKVF